jgi:Holliday junction resolvase RusA-like endonuclease
VSDRGADIRFVIPGPPKPLQRNRHRIVKKKGGGQFVANYLPAESRSEQGAVRMFASLAMAGRPPLEGPLDLRMTAFMPVPPSWSQKKQRAALDGLIYPTGKPDCSNLVKLVEDAMLGVCYRDDSQIVSLHVWKAYSDRPRTVAEIRSLDPRPVVVAPNVSTESTGRSQSPLVGISLFE